MGQASFNRLPEDILSPPGVDVHTEQPWQRHVLVVDPFFLHNPDGFREGAFAPRIHLTKTTLDEGILDGVGDQMHQPGVSFQPNDFIHFKVGEQDVTTFVVNVSHDDGDLVVIGGNWQGVRINHPAICTGRALKDQLDPLLLRHRLTYCGQ